MKKFKKILLIICIILICLTVFVITRKKQITKQYYIEYSMYNVSNLYGKELLGSDDILMKIENLDEFNKFFDEEIQNIAKQYFVERRGIDEEKFKRRYKKEFEKLLESYDVFPEEKENIKEQYNINENFFKNNYLVFFYEYENVSGSAKKLKGVRYDEKNKKVILINSQPEHKRGIYSTPQVEGSAYAYFIIIDKKYNGEISWETLYGKENEDVINKIKSSPKAPQITPIELELENGKNNSKVMQELKEISLNNTDEITDKLNSLSRDELREIASNSSGILNPDYNEFDLLNEEYKEEEKKQEQYRLYSAHNKKEADELCKTLVEDNYNATIDYIGETDVYYEYRITSTEKENNHIYDITRYIIFKTEYLETDNKNCSVYLKRLDETSILKTLDPYFETPLYRYLDEDDDNFYYIRYYITDSENITENSKISLKRETYSIKKETGLFKYTPIETKYILKNIVHPGYK